MGNVIYNWGVSETNPPHISEINKNDIVPCDVHTHSVSSGHGTSDTLADIAKVAAARGMTLLGLTDHGPATMCAGTVSYFRSLAYAPKKRCGIDILYGAELNILDDYGKLDLEDEVLDKLDYAIASMHTNVIKPGSVDENTERYIQAMKHPRVKIIGHPDDEKYPIDHLALVQAAMEHHVVLEINNSSLSPDGYRGDAKSCDEQILSLCLTYDYPILLSSDSHGAAGVGVVPYAKKLAMDCGFSEDLILNYQPEILKRFLV